MIIDQRYNQVKEGSFTKEAFLEEAKRDHRLARHMSNFTTFDELVGILHNRGLIFEEKEPANKFSTAKWLKESISDDINEPKGTVHMEHVNAFEYEKGWRYELKAIGKFDEESVQKAQQKAVKNLEKDAIHYTKLEMRGHVPDEKGHKELDVSKGQNLVDKDSQAKPVKIKKDADGTSYVDKMQKQGRGPKLMKDLNEGSALDDLTKSHENDKNPLVTAEKKDPENKLPGGKGDKLSAADVDQDELSMGLSVEAEHTSDPEIAKEIALDHLSEDPHYYSKLKKTGLEEKVNALKEVIRKVVKEKLLKEYSYVPEPSGPDVDRDRLKTLLQGMTWPAVGDQSSDGVKYPNNGYNDRVDQEKVDKIKAIVDRLGQEGIDLYNHYAPKGCKWGEDNDIFGIKEDAEDAEPKIHQDIKDLQDMDPKDLAKMVLNKEFDSASVKNKIALKVLGQAIQDGEKDQAVRKAFTTLADKFKGKDIQEQELSKLKKGTPEFSKAKKELVKKLKTEANKAVSKLIASTFDTNERNLGTRKIMKVLDDKLKEVEKL